LPRSHLLRQGAFTEIHGATELFLLYKEAHRDFHNLIGHFVSIYHIYNIRCATIR